MTGGRGEPATAQAGRGIMEALRGLSTVERIIVAAALAGPSVGHAGAQAVLALEGPALLGLVMLNLMVGPTLFCLGMAAMHLGRKPGAGSLGARVNPFWLGCAGVNAGIVLTAPAAAGIMLLGGVEIPTPLVLTALAAPLMAAVMLPTIRRIPLDPEGQVNPDGRVNPEAAGAPEPPGNGQGPGEER